MSGAREDFVILDFVKACANADYQSAIPLLLNLVIELENNSANFINSQALAESLGLIGDDIDQQLVNQLCESITILFANRQYDYSDLVVAHLFLLNRCFALLFAASKYTNADHILRALFAQQAENPNQLIINPRDYLQFCLFYCGNSQLPLNIEQIWQENQTLAIAFAGAQLTQYCFLSVNASNKRELLLNWLCNKLEQIEQCNIWPFHVIHYLYLSCSYVNLPSRHRIKVALNRLIRQQLISDGFTDIEVKRNLVCREKPVLLVVLECFSSSHSVFRTHAKSLAAARDKFTVIALGFTKVVNAAGQELFDQFHDIPMDNVVGFVREMAIKLAPDVLYYPSLGMLPHTILLANLRLAAVQVTSYGHSASSMSPYIDYYILPEDMLGNWQCFSEKIISVKASDMPFIPTSHRYALAATIRKNPPVVNIAIAASLMKLNPTFLATLQQIEKKAGQLNHPVQYNFHLAYSYNLVYLELRQLILNYLPQAKIHLYQPYREYLANLNNNDMFLSPFPFGNNNGIVDAISIGLVGVNKTGEEVFELIDQAMFKRIGLPDFLSAKSIDEYIAAALTLICHEELRNSLREKLLQDHAEEVFYQGDGAGFALALLEKCAM